MNVFLPFIDFMISELSTRFSKDDQSTILDLFNLVSPKSNVLVLAIAKSAEMYAKDLPYPLSLKCYSCHLLGDYLESVKREFSTAAKVYQTNCDEYKYPKSCLKYGNYCYLGKGIEENVTISLDYYKKACDLNVAQGCLYTGVMLTKEKKIEKKNFVEGLKFLEKSCSLGNPTACYYASGLYITGAEGISVNKNKASHLSLIACNGGNIFACMNLSQMYKAGDGVEKDEKKSDEFKERAKEIRDDLRKKESIGLQQYS